MPPLPTSSHPTSKFIPPKKCILDFFSQINNMFKPIRIIITTTTTIIINENFN